MNNTFGERPETKQDRAKSVHTVFRAFLGLMCLIGAGMSSIVGEAQPAALPPSSAKGTNTPLANRWLIIVETSKRMRARADGVQQTVPGLVFSGMNGQMWRGDTLGLWTFNEELHAGQFPLQEWTPGNSQAIALQVSDFLKNQKYENDSYLDKVLPYMQRVIKGSDYITVLLISDGRKKISGTPFDNKINTFYQTWDKQQDKAHMPFVTVLRADHGQITNYAVTIPPYPLELPPLPPELTKRMVEPAPTQTAAQRMLPPLIVHGKKPEPEPAVAPAVATVTNVAPSVSMATNEIPGHESASTATVAGEKPVASPPATASAAPAAVVPASTKTNAAAVIPVVAGTATNPSPQTSEPAPSAKPESSAQGTETTPDRFWSHKLIWIAAVGAVVIAFWLGWMKGRSSAPFRVSLVSHSSEQEKRK